jgi:hypothetical protein
MASNNVELSEEQQLDSAASHNPVLSQPDLSSGHARDNPRAGMYAKRGVVIGQLFFGKRDRASGLRRNLSVDRYPERKLALVLLTNRTWQDRANKAIQEARPAFHVALAEGMALAARRIF